MFNFLRRKYVGYVNWEEYKKKIDFLDHYYFQQSVRRENIKLLS